MLHPTCGRISVRDKTKKLGGPGMSFLTGETPMRKEAADWAPLSSSVWHLVSFWPRRGEQPDEVYMKPPSCFCPSNATHTSPQSERKVHGEEVNQWEVCTGNLWGEAEPSRHGSPAPTSGLCALRFEPREDGIIKAGPSPTSRIGPGPLQSWGC